MVGSEPSDVRDHQLWRDAELILGLHVLARGERCEACGHAWPCVARLSGERAKLAALGSWCEAWTARHDLQTTMVLAGARGGRLSPTRGRELLD